MESFLTNVDQSLNPMRHIICQQEDDEIEAGIEKLSELYEEARKITRQSTPASVLNIGMKCGGSDAFSGITANPLVGKIADMHIDAGGTVVLTETPEMFGAETILMNRCESEQKFTQLVLMIEKFKKYFKSYNLPVFENPSPGNKEGGITTLEEKSLGCIQKGGNSTVTEIVPYGSNLSQKGLILLDSPGNDPISTTALGASGCHMVVYTTGRGTPFTCFVPCVKISSNSQLAKKKKHWIDYDAGLLLTEKDFIDASDELYDKILDVASGKTFLGHEQYLMREVAIWKNGVTL